MELKDVCVGDKVEYIEYGKWQAYSEYYERYYEVDPPIAWCEIPKFEEWTYAWMWIFYWCFRNEIS